MLEILNVPPGSSASELGLGRGDILVSINGNAIHDVIDFRFFAAYDRVTLTVKKKRGGIRSIRVSKEPDDSLGLEFAPIAVKRCRNKCIFCFVDQMPPGCRKTLYVKDDDFRASFLYGNFITLGALSDPDWKRIFTQRLSPLYISVHTTNHELRSSMLRNKKAPDILASLKRLASGGIRIHAQIVLCPGINDGEHLVKTLNDLSGLFPSVSSIAIVPVGVTGFREGTVPDKNIFEERSPRRA